MEKTLLSNRFFPSSVLYFLSLCQTFSYTKTAKLLNTSQSSVSRCILELEQHLGFQLIERETRPIKITKYGQLLYQQLSNHQSELDQLLTDIFQNNLKHISLRFGVIESLADCLAKPILKRLDSEYSTALNLTAISTRLLELLDSDKLDFIISSNPFSFRNDLQRYFLLQEPSLVVVPKGLNLPEPLTWERLKYCGLPKISYDSSNSGAMMERRLFNENGLSFVNRIEVDLNVTMMSLVAAGMGWALTRGSSLVQFPEYSLKVDVYEMPEPLASREIFLIYKNQAFVDMAEKMADVIRQTLVDELIPEMLSWVPWIKPYLWVQGRRPLERVRVFPDSKTERTPTVF